MIPKVLAYITRHSGAQVPLSNGVVPLGRGQGWGYQLLVFDHRDHPDAGTQVPAGTVEPNEPIETALFREVQEESGLTNVQLIRKLAEYESKEWGTIRHVFHLTVTSPLPDSWSHIVQGKGEDEGLVFNYYWLDLKPGLTLADNQHQWLDLISTV